MPILSNVPTEEVIEWAKGEVIRQREDLDPYLQHMLSAWRYGIKICNEWRSIDEHDIHVLGGIVKGVFTGSEPYARYRQTPVSFANGSLGLNWEQIERQMSLIFIHQGSYNVDDWTKRLLDIHPFEDGNGRVASIVWNIKNGTILHPVPLPDFYKAEA